jgi:hypothetical protein
MVFMSPVGRLKNNARCVFEPKKRLKPAKEVKLCNTQNRLLWRRTTSKAVLRRDARKKTVGPTTVAKIAALIASGHSNVPKGASGVYLGRLVFNKLAEDKTRLKIIGVLASSMWT